MKEFWRKVNDEYELESDALLILRTACEQFDRAQQAREDIAKNGFSIGNRVNPALAVEKVAVGLFLRSVRQLGLDIVAPGPIGRPPGR
jgi:hypothetical protein